MLDPARDWERELDAFLTPFLAALGRATQRRMGMLYLRGLLGPGERKSVQPLAARLGLPSHDALHHFIADAPWAAESLARVLAATADRLVGGPDAALVVDDTALPKQGTRSVGVARQYAGALGKRANCQTLVSLTLARAEVPVPVALRLFLPEEWARDPERCARAGVPEEHRTPRPTKTELALAEIDRLRAGGLRFGAVLADAGYGGSAAFRRGLSARGLTWAVGIPRIQKVYPVDVELTWPPCTSRGRPRRRPRRCRAPSRGRPRRCWPTSGGGGSSGGAAPKAPWPPRSPSAGCGWRTDRRARSVPARLSICRARRCG